MKPKHGVVGITRAAGAVGILLCLACGAVGQNAGGPPAVSFILNVGHRDDVTAVAFSPDGGTLASASEDGTIELWDPATGKLLATIWALVRDGEVQAWVTWTPGGYYDCSEGAERYIRFRDEQGTMHRAGDYARIFHNPDKVQAALGR